MAKIRLSRRVATTSRRDNKVQMIRPLFGLPYGILHVFNTILYENELQNPQIFQQTISLFPEQSSLVPMEHFFGVQ
jgi:hypothetical protein